MKLEYKYELSSYGYVYAAICIINKLYAHAYTGKGRAGVGEPNISERRRENRTFFYSSDIFYHLILYILYFIGVSRRSFFFLSPALKTMMFTLVCFGAIDSAVFNI